MPRYICPGCQTKVQDKGKDDGIACEVCRKWYHFSCSNLTDKQFEIFCKIQTLEWICPKCVEDECSKCEKIFRHDKRITCNLCYQNYHITCGGLNKQSYLKIDPGNWFCHSCNNNIFPFNTVPPKKIESLSFNSLCPDKHPNKLPNSNFQINKNEADIPPNTRCKVCSKNISKVNKAIPCPSCNHLIHRTCSALNQSQIINFKRTKNIQVSAPKM
jgi:DNA-directed RNA polymerase subunit RPC12/RpoP